ncbi:hypothetical protein [Kocuria rosea]|uniref:hypothetical protein n=1 Tax=Kocuria rosea TaxID=1275 RepID=UPI0011A1DFFD|nr:hypothetical protein [Kocuria rosea]
MDRYEYRRHWAGHIAAGWTIEPSAAGPHSPGIRFTSPTNHGGWLPLDQVDDFADALKSAARASAAQYSNRAVGWAA